MVIYFLDTYAILEIVKGNRNYQKYEQERVVTSKLNLFEVHYKLLREVSLEMANIVLRKYTRFLIDFGIEEIIEASKFKLINKKRKLSMVDCIGYILALKNEAKFLTGDKEFKDMRNVEFVK